MEAVAQVDPVGEHGKGGGLKDESLTITFDILRPAEISAFKSFCHDPVSGSIEVEDFDEVASFIGEEEGSSAGGVDLDGVAGDLGEAIEALAHVTGLEGDVDLKVPIEGEHDDLGEGFEKDPEEPCFIRSGYMSRGSAREDDGEAF